MTVFTARFEVARLSTRVALAAPELVVAAYLVIDVAVVGYVTSSLTSQVDGRLTETLEHVAAEPFPEGGPRPRPPGDRPLGQERAIWTISADGSVATDQPDLVLPAGSRAVTSP